MLINPYHVELERHRRRELREAMRRQRLAQRARRSRGLRHVLGHSMIRIGSRLVADPARERARSL
jgi:hypothetical protein